MDSVPDILYVAGSRKVFALHTATGEILWQTKLGGLFTASSLLTLLVAGDLLFVAGSSGVACLDRWQGQRLWENGKVKLAYPTMAIPGEAVGTAPGASAAAADAAGGA